MESADRLVSTTLTNSPAAELTVQALSGQWREATPGLVALATNSQANVWDWAQGAAAALAAGDTNAYARLYRLGRMRYAGNAEAESAKALWWCLATPCRRR